MTFTVAKAIVDVQRHLYANTRPVRNSLNIAAVTSDVQIILGSGTDTAAYVPLGSWVAVDRELMWVTDNAATATLQILTVRRGESGTVAAAHAQGAVVEVNPRFAAPHIADGLQDELRSWQPDLYRVGAVSYPVTEFPTTFDVGASYANAYGPTVVRVLNNTTSSGGGASWPTIDSSVLAGMAVSDYPSGTALYIPRPSSSPNSPTTVHVVWGLPFNMATFTDATDLVATVGLAESMVDVAVLGTVIRMLTSREVPRSDPTAQGQPRDAAEVGVGAQLQVSSGLRQLYMARISDERRKLQARFPIRFS